MAAVQRQHEAIVRVSYAENLVAHMWLKINGLLMVEAAGVEPASEIDVNKERLHAQSRSEDFALRAQNGQGARNASLWISSSLPRRSGEDQPAVRRPLAARGQSHQERQLN